MIPVVSAQNTEVNQNAAAHFRWCKLKSYFGWGNIKTIREVSKLQECTFILRPLDMNWDESVFDIINYYCITYCKLLKYFATCSLLYMMLNKGLIMETANLSIDTLPPSQASGEAKKAGGPQAYRLTPPCDLGDCSSVMQCSNQWNIVLSVSHFYHLLPFGSQLLQLLNICPCGEGWKVLCLIALRGRGGPHCT